MTTIDDHSSAGALLGRERASATDVPVAAVPHGDEAAQLDEDCRELYQELVGAGPGSVGGLMATLCWPEERVHRTVATLTRLRLVTGVEAGEIRVVRPEIAASAYLMLEQNVLIERVTVLDRARQQILSLLPVYDAASSPSTSDASVETVADVGSVRSLLQHWSSLARQQVLIAHPGGGMDRDGIDRSLSLDREMLDRGLGLRSLLAHDTRQHAGTRRYVEGVTERGGEVRTTAAILPKTIVFDDIAAFLPAAEGQGAVVVTDPGVVRYVASVFDMAWLGAQPYSLAADEAASMTNLHVALLRQLASGRKDEQIARHLGLSLRTCRRHIATIMAELGCASRFQAGVVAVSQSLIDGSDALSITDESSSG